MTPTGYLLMKNIPAQKWCAPIYNRSHVLGRALEADIKVPSEFGTVSRRHAEIGCDRGLFWIRDLGSLGGTRVNDVQIPPHQKFQIAAGDRLWIGGMEMDVVGLPSLVEGELPPRPPREGDTKELRRQKQTNSVEAAQAPENWQQMVQALTPTELEVVLWMARGFTSPETVGEQMGRSKNTVRTHMNSIFHKLNIHSRDELLAMIRRSASELASLLD